MELTPKEKAKELFDKMKGFRVMHSHSIKCAKVAVREIIAQLPNQSENHLYVYWNEVLTELNNLKK